MTRPCCARGWIEVEISRRCDDKMVYLCESEENSDTQWWPIDAGHKLKAANDKGREMLDPHREELLKKAERLCKARSHRLCWDDVSEAFRDDWLNVAREACRMEAETLRRNRMHVHANCRGLYDAEISELEAMAKGGA